MKHLEEWLPHNKCPINTRFKNIIVIIIDGYPRLLHKLGLGWHCCSVQNQRSVEEPRSCFTTKFHVAFVLVPFNIFRITSSTKLGKVISRHMFVTLVESQVLYNFENGETSTIWSWVMLVMGRTCSTPLKCGSFQKSNVNCKIRWKSNMTLIYTSIK